MQNHFPERLGVAIAYRAPRIFSFMWKGVHSAGCCLKAYVHVGPMLSKLLTQFLPCSPAPESSHSLLRRAPAGDGSSDQVGERAALPPLYAISSRVCEC